MGVNNMPATSNETDLMIFMHEFNTINQDIINNIIARENYTSGLRGANTTMDIARLAQHINHNTVQIEKLTHERGILQNRYEKFLTDKGMIDA